MISTIKATRTLIYKLINCVCSEYSVGAHTHKNCLMEVHLKARIDDSKAVQARIIDR